MATQGRHSAPQNSESDVTTTYVTSAPNTASREKSLRRRKRRRLSNLLLVVGVCLLVGAGGGFGYMWWQYKDGLDRYMEVQDISGIKAEQVQAIEEGKAFVLDIDWDALREINGDVVGWLLIPSVDVINYPVVQGVDNEEYLTKSYDGDPGKYGSVFMDRDSFANLSDLHTVIYGHHLRNGQMFAQLANYTDQGFFEDHDTVIYATPDATHVLKVIGAYAMPAEDEMRTTVFTTWDEYYSYVESQLAKSEVTCDIDPRAVGHLYSLITCSYNTNDERTVVLCYEPGK